MQRIGKSLERRIRHFRMKHFNLVRPTIKAVIDMFGEDAHLIGCEVGTFKGKHAETMLNVLPNIFLYLVDPYERYAGYTDFNSVKDGMKPTFLSDAQIEAKERLEKYNDRIEWIQAPFHSDLIPEQLDFIYIDGNHSHGSVLQDIEHAELLVDKGIIGGHDYYPIGHYMEDKYGVGRAVRDSYQGFGWKYNDWWIRYD